MIFKNNLAKLSYSSYISIKASEKPRIFLKSTRMEASHTTYQNIITPPSWTSFPPPTPSHSCMLSQGPRFELPTSFFKFPLATYVVVFLFPCYSPNMSCPLLLPLCPQVCSLWLCFLCCPAFRFISTMFLLMDSINMC